MSLTLRNRQPFRLVADPDGPHKFGGDSSLQGAVPRDSNVPVQLALSLDLSDPAIPIESEIGLSTLPLCYPFKYGCGGPEMQYTVLSDKEIQIVFLSDLKADAPDEQYIQVSQLPEATFRLEPLSYEQARILGFMNVDAHFQPNKFDWNILNELDTQILILIGGYNPQIWDSMGTVCYNPKCVRFNKRVNFESISLLPPISVDGADEFWYEFQGAHMQFCFGLCRYCGAVFATNIAS